jgi:unsaturated chondroitin disaccharide hydrolase
MFNPDTGEYIGEHGGQGYAAGSAWSRGQGWALYGFTLAYKHTRKPEFLAAAKRSADFVIEQLSANDYLPLVDFRAPNEPVKIDTSAGAIIACGLLELAKYDVDYGYHTAAIRLTQVIHMSC